MASQDPLIVVFGFGSQGSAQARNLRDSGRRVAVSLRQDSPRKRQVISASMNLIQNPAEAARQADIAAILISDSEQAEFWKSFLEPNLKHNASVVFAHGFNIHYGFIKPRVDLDIVLVAPLGQADTVRSEFTKGRGVPCAVSVFQDATGGAWDTADYFAKGISNNAPQIKTTFAEETESDLFAEQAVLCGGLNALIKASFDTLVDHGINPDIAYYSSLREVRALANLIYEHGITKTREKISDTARYGDVTRGPRVIDEHVRAVLKDIFNEIRSGAFAKEYNEEIKAGFPAMKEIMEKEKEHLIEKIHERFSEKNKKKT